MHQRWEGQIMKFSHQRKQDREFPPKQWEVGTGNIENRRKHGREGLRRASRSIRKLEKERKKIKWEQRCKRNVQGGQPYRVRSWSQTDAVSPGLYGVWTLSPKERREPARRARSSRTAWMEKRRVTSWLCNPEQSSLILLPSKPHFLSSKTEMKNVSYPNSCTGTITDLFCLFQRSYKWSHRTLCSLMSGWLL